MSWKFQTEAPSSGEINGLQHDIFLKVYLFVGMAEELIAPWVNLNSNFSSLGNLESFPKMYLFVEPDPLLRSAENQKQLRHFLGGVWVANKEEMTVFR